MDNLSLKKLHVTQKDGFNQLYMDGLITVDKVDSVVMDGAVYKARNNQIVTSTGKKNIIELVLQGKSVYFLS